MKLRIALAVCLAVIFLEAYARLGLGLGDPPLTVRDPKIDYMFKPNSVYHRFGNLVSYNSYAMRSSEPPAGQAHVLVFSDSVMNGGALTASTCWPSSSRRKGSIFGLAMSRLGPGAQPRVPEGQVPSDAVV